MKVCQNCSHENKESSKFCVKCGKKLEDTPKFCPECGTALDGISRFCPECGYNLASLQGDEEPVDDRYQNSYSDDDYHNSSSYDDSSNSDDYESSESMSDLQEEFSNTRKEFSDTWNELQEQMAEIDRLSQESDDLYADYEDDETSEEKIKDIVDKYIKTINKSNTAYTSGAVQNSEYSQIFQNVRMHIAKDVNQSDIYGFIDTTVFGKGKSGLVFTADAIFEKGAGSYAVIPYRRMTNIYIKGHNLYFDNTIGCGSGLLGSKIDVFIGNTFYNLPALKDCLEEIQSVL